jgi:arginine utilization protein RocB
LSPDAVSQGSEGCARCTNCGHMHCLFHGEDRTPVYNGAAGRVLCWFPVCGRPSYGGL